MEKKVKSSIDTSKYTPKITGEPMSCATYVGNFMKSEPVLLDLQKRLKDATAVCVENKEIPPTPEEVANAYFITEKAKDRFWEYFFANPFNVDMSSLSDSFKYKLEAYFKELRALKSAERFLRDEIVERDEIRSAKHTVAAERLAKDGIFPSFTLARVFVHILAVHEGLDAWDPERDKRVREVLAARAAFDGGR